jgi:hypothetical protein
MWEVSNVGDLILRQTRDRGNCELQGGFILPSEQLQEPSNPSSPLQDITLLDLIWCRWRPSHEWSCEFFASGEVMKFNERNGAPTTSHLSRWLISKSLDCDRELKDDKEVFSTTMSNHFTTTWLKWPITSAKERREESETESDRA